MNESGDLFGGKLTHLFVVIHDVSEPVTGGEIELSRYHYDWQTGRKCAPQGRQGGQRVVGSKDAVPGICRGPLVRSTTLGPAISFSEVGAFQ